MAYDRITLNNGLRIIGERMTISSLALTPLFFL